MEVIWIWVAPGEDAANWPADLENRGPRCGQRNVVYIVDVDGAGLVIDTWHMSATS
jgi:hypothetical protein